MKIFAIKSYTNYGEMVILIVAEDEAEARAIADKNEYVWEGYDIAEVDTTTKGVVFMGGGEN